MLYFREEALAPVDIAFGRPALEIILDPAMCRKRLVDQLARARMKLLQAQEIGLENLDEFPALPCGNPSDGRTRCCS
jgi:hypothetical protein